MNNKFSHVHSGSQKLSQKGFSLIELLIIVALVAIVSAIAFPQLNKVLPGIRVKGDTRSLALEMNLTKVRAISENKYYWIKFDTSSGGPWGYKVYADADGDKSLNVSTDTLVDTVPLSSGIRFGTASASMNKTDNSSCCVPDDGVTFHDDEIPFLPSGRGDAGAAYLIPTSDATSGRKDRMMAVVMSPITYKISVYRYTGNSWGRY